MIKSFLKATIIIVSCCVMLLNPSFVFAKGTKKNSPPSVGLTNSNTPKIISKSRLIEEVTSRYSVKINYPILENKFADEFISSWINQQILFFTDSVENIPSNDPTHFSLNINYEIIHTSNKIVSILFNITTSTGNPTFEVGIATFSFDLKNNKKLELEDIFKSTEYFYTFMSDYSRQELQKNNFILPFTERFLDGTKPYIDNFSFFCLDKNGIVVFFLPGQVVSSMYGMQRVNVPISTLSKFNPDLTLWENLTTNK